MDKRVFVAMLSATLLAISCGGGGKTPQGGCEDCDLGCLEEACLPSRPDIVWDQGGPEDLFGPQEDITSVEIAEEEVEEPNQGGFRWPCETNFDCTYGLCLPTLSGKVCTVPCLDECPDPTWVCEYLSPPGMDPQYFCVPPKTAACRPCSLDNDCDVGAKEEAVCAVYGPQGRFCAVLCEEGADCQKGFVCTEVLTSLGELKKACVAESHDCPCLFGFIGLSTQCYVQNEFGTCFGLRQCTKTQEAATWLPCDAKTPAKEECNGIDDDCNGVPDDGLGTFICGTGVCQRELPTCKDGKVVVCDPYEGARPEMCNNLDDDCDGETDELWPDKGHPCDGPDPDKCENGNLGCSDDGKSLVCMHDDVNHVEVCNGLDDDCDGETDEVEDLGETTCGKGICLHTIPNCVGGKVQTCNPMEGAQEFDDPDPDYLDTNCDGIDGDIKKSVFVDVATGKDLNPGTPDLPKKTISAGIQQAKQDGKPYVLVSLGVYNETVTLADGISVVGQYDKASGWTRKPENTTQIKGGTRAVIAVGIQKPTTLQGFLVTSESASNPGESSYGVFAKDSPGLTLVSNIIQAGNGASGQAGANGASGLNGSNGSNGSPGCEYDCRGDKIECAFSACLVNSCGSCSRPKGGEGGASPCGSKGGKGGDGGDADSSGYPGGNGAGPSGGKGGIGGSKGANGFPGENGLDGLPGADGSGGLSFGVAGPDGYLTADGVQGAQGTNGSGGGGGGGGGGDKYSFAQDCCKTYGSSGGGGGGGGCGGQGGQGGQGGGGSFGVFVVGAKVRVEKCVIKTGQGGNGGSGGAGGAGGAGGVGGQGGPHGDNDDQGDGAAGGKGGAGGRGGHGGGGGGGPSVGIVCGPQGAVVLKEVNFVLGQGGAGGSSPGNSGAAGLKAETYGCLE